jgi:Flp pilus assembly protein TadG
MKRGSAMRISQIIERHLRVFRADSRGTSAVEFSFIAPMLIIIAISLADVNALSYGSSNMQSAVRAGMHYAMAGGTDAAVAKNHAETAWTMKPGDGVLTSSRACKCAGTVVGDCDAFCADGTRPEMYITVSATGTVGGDLYSKVQTASETVRVR